MNKQKKSVASQSNNNQPTHALIYCRRATTQQTRDNHGIRAQEKNCREYAKSKGYVVEKSMVLQDVASGADKHTKRPGLVKALKLIDKHPQRKFVVVVNDLSRISRDISAFHSYCEALRARGVTIEALEQSADYKFAEALFDTVARYEHDTRRQRALRSIKARKTRGK